METGIEKLFVVQQQKDRNIGKHFKNQPKFAGKLCLSSKNHYLFNKNK